jgi:hypothetical protein
LTIAFDRRHVRLDTNKMALLDVKGRDGVRLLPLFKDAHEDVRLRGEHKTKFHRKTR